MYLVTRDRILFDSPKWNNDKLFRNYLRAHPKEVECYSKLKARLAKIHTDDHQAYSNDKNTFIKSIIAKA